MNKGPVLSEDHTGKVISIIIKLNFIKLSIID